METKDTAYTVRLHSSLLHSLPFMDQHHPFLPGLYTWGISFLLSRSLSSDFQHAFAFALQKAEPFLDLAEGWHLHSVLQPQTQGISSGSIYTVEYCLLFMPRRKSAPSLRHVRKHKWEGQREGNQGCPTGTVGPSEMDMFPLPSRAPIISHHILRRWAVPGEQARSAHACLRTHWVQAGREGRVHIPTSRATALSQRKPSETAAPQQTLPALHMSFGNKDNLDLRTHPLVSNPSHSFIRLQAIEDNTCQKALRLFLGLWKMFCKCV